MREHYFSVAISFQDFTAYYRQQVQYVQLYDVHGQQLLIHARYFIPYLTYQGIHGIFLMRLDEQGKFLALHKQDEA